MLDCSELPGHFRKICDGTYRKSTGRIHTTKERCEILSRHLRIEVDPTSISDATDSPSSKSEVGSRLHEIIERDVGKIECGECRDEVTRLNLLSVDDIQRQKELIADGMVERGKKKAPKFWQRWGASLAPGIAKQQALSWIDEACSSEGMS